MKKYIYLPNSCTPRNGGEIQQTVIAKIAISNK